MLNNMASPENAAFAQANVQQETESHSRKHLDFQRIAGTCAVGLALAVSSGAGSETADAHESAKEALPSIERVASYTKAEERKVERSLKKRLLQGKKPRIYQGTIEWEVTESDSEEIGYDMDLPIVEKVRQKNGKRTDRYFEVLSGYDSDKQIVVKAINPYARKVQTANNKFDGTISRYAVKFNKNHTPIIRQASSTHKAKGRNVPIARSKLRTGRGNIESLSPGKRYAEQFETVRLLRGVENLQEFKSVMQDYLDQYKVQLNITPEEVIQKPGSYTVEYLKESDLPAAKKFAFAVVDEMSKFPKDFPTEIGMKQMDVVSSGRRSGEEGFTALANIQDQRVVFTMKSRNDTVQHEGTHFAAINALNMRDNDTAWQSFNPPGFRYTGYTSLCKGDDIVCGRGAKKSSWPGFASEYSEANADEDIAEVGALVMCNEYDDLKKIAEEDPILGNKITYFISRMGQRFPFFTDHYLKKINPTKSC